MWMAVKAVGLNGIPDRADGVMREGPKAESWVTPTCNCTERKEDARRRWRRCREGRRMMLRDLRKERVSGSGERCQVAGPESESLRKGY